MWALFAACLGAGLAACLGARFDACLGARFDAGLGARLGAVLGAGLAGSGASSGTIAAGVIAVRAWLGPVEVLWYQ